MIPRLSLLRAAVISILAAGVLAYLIDFGWR
jgi:hypothetical protein